MKCGEASAPDPAFMFTLRKSLVKSAKLGANTGQPTLDELVGED